MNTPAEENSAAPISLSYANAGEYRATPVLLTLSYVAGILPLTAGILELLLFLITRQTLFAVAGFFTLFVGGAVVGIGLILVTIYLWQARHATVDRANSLYNGRKALVILLLNFPAAVSCAVSGMLLLSEHL